MPAKKETGRGAYEWVQGLVCTVVALVLLFTFVVRVVRVNGPSMRETLQDQDLVLLLSSWLCGGFQQGDVVVLQRKTFNGSKPIIKRVIATEGQTVDINFETGTVRVNGEILDEPYLREPTWIDEGMEFPLTVPEGCIFVMGDNRNNSDDSRNPALGPVDTRSVVGKAVVLLVPGLTAQTQSRDWSRVGVLN